MRETEKDVKMLSMVTREFINGTMSSSHRLDSGNGTAVVVSANRSNRRRTNGTTRNHSYAQPSFVFQFCDPSWKLISKQLWGTHMRILYSPTSSSRLESINSSMMSLIQIT